MFERLCDERGVILGKGKGDPHAKDSKKATVALLASDLGVAERTAKHRVAQEWDACCLEGAIAAYGLPDVGH